MKKKFLISLAIITLALTVFVGCGKKVECDFCGEEKKCEERTFFEETIFVCEDCIDELNG